MTKTNKEPFVERIAKLFSWTPQKVQSDLDEINAGEQNLPRVTNQAWSAIEKANHPPYLFRYGGVPCRLEHNDNGVLVVRQLTQDRLRYEVARVAEWFKWTDGKKKPAKPLMDVVKNMLATPDPPLPVLSRITEVPVFAPDGTLQTEPGYHPAARVYYSPPKSFTVSEVDNPTPEDISQAKDLIFGELLVDFPFVSDADRAQAVALFLLPYVRDLIDGPTPNHLVESPVPGSGKGLLVDACLRPALGQHLGFIPQANDEAEWRKRITASLIEGRGAIVIDNLRSRLDSGVLAAALTTIYWADRILGRSEMVNLPVRCVWVTTGNNPMVSTEIARRSIRIRLDAGVERPWELTNFKHPSLREWADEHRPDLVWAALTLVQAWIVAGKPLWQARTLGSYENWSAVMGGILGVNGIKGFLENLDDFYATADAEASEWELFLEKWWKEFDQKAVGVGELILLAEEAGLQFGGDTEHSKRVSLGTQLRQHRDQIIGEYRITSAGKAQGALQWQLVPTVSLMSLSESPDPNLKNVGKNHNG